MPSTKKAAKKKRKQRRAAAVAAMSAHTPAATSSEYQELRSLLTQCQDQMTDFQARLKITEIENMKLCRANTELRQQLESEQTQARRSHFLPENARVPPVSTDSLSSSSAPAHTVDVVAAEQTSLPRDEYNRTPPNPNLGLGQYWSEDKRAWVPYQYKERIGQRPKYTFPDAGPE